MLKSVYEAALAAEREGVGAALVTVVGTEGSTPQKAGACMLVREDGTCVGTIGGGCVENEMVRRARLAIARRRPELASYELTADQAGEDGLVCGGRMQVFVDPLEPEPVLLVFGAGHVAVPLCRMARMAGFQVEVADDRAQFANAERFPDARAVVVEETAAAAARMSLGPGAYAVVVTRGHRGDADALHAVLGRGLRYVGLLGSRPKMVHVFAELKQRGVSPAELEKVHVPMGLGIGARTPEEIAVSILAELIAVRRGVPPEQVGSMKAPLPGRLREAP
ncbi:MAG: XdhC family protein [Vicinamibacteria bacterium]|nr:XdhC family protein [Vicinamibacteria bacterium]